MQQELALEKGSVLLSDDKIRIQDNAKREHIIRLVSSSLWTFFGIISVLRYLKTGDEFLLWTGTIIGLGHLFMLAFFLFRTTKAEVYLNDIQQVAFKSRNGNKFMDLKLSNGLKRRVSRIAPVSNELRTFFTEKNITVV
jgi:hypothetical protein